MMTVPRCCLSCLHLGAESVVDMFLLSIRTNLLVVFIFHDPSRTRFFDVAFCCTISKQSLSSFSQRSP